MPPLPTSNVASAGTLHNADQMNINFIGGDIPAKERSRATAAGSLFLTMQVRKKNGGSLARSSIRGRRLSIILATKTTKSPNIPANCARTKGPWMTACKLCGDTLAIGRIGLTAKTKKAGSTIATGLRRNTGSAPKIGGRSAKTSSMNDQAAERLSCKRGHGHSHVSPQLAPDDESCFIKLLNANSVLASFFNLSKLSSISTFSQLFFWLRPIVSNFIPAQLILSLSIAPVAVHLLTPQVPFLMES